MAGPSRYERSEIESLLGSALRDPPPMRDGLVVMPGPPEFERVSDVAVMPALRGNGLNATPVSTVFRADSPLEHVAREILAAEVIVADVTLGGSEMMYFLGLCHGFGRCPLLICRRRGGLPFDLASLRHVAYEDDFEGLLRLRDDLSRAIRVFLASCRVTGPGGKG